MEFKSKYREYFNNYVNLKLNLNYKYDTSIRELKRFDNFLFENNYKEITLEIIEKWISKNKNWDINTKARNVGTIKQFIIYLNNNEITNIKINPSLIKQYIRKHVPHIFSHEEIKNIIDGIDNYYTLKEYHMKYTMSFLIRLLYGTGMRLGEALSINKDNIDIDSGIIKLIDTKNGEERLVVLTDDLNNRLKQYLSKMNRDTTYLFYSLNCNKLSHSVIENHFYKILKYVGIKRTDNGPRVHDLRFTHITHSLNNYVKEGKDPRILLPILMTYVGHKNLTSTEYYLKSTNESLDFIREKSEEYYNDIGKEINFNE